ncbi:MAG: B12-binding domain-containing radical SAM protein [Verrucomicrobia bacterium]|nr:MAG: B12-binding domain-containing radical SAM protein [Verrucomicrobiota bacterium]
MKVLFVYTDVAVRGGALSYQFGVAMLSAVLKQHGHDTRLHYMYGKYDVEPLRQDIAAWRPDVVAFSGVSPQYRYVKRAIEQLAPIPAFTIYGGVHPTLDTSCLEEVRGLDAICVGEGEFALLELVEALRDGKPVDNILNLWIKKKDGSIIRNPTRPWHKNLDELPYPDYDLFEFQKICDSDFNTALFMFTRGCPYNCTFCSNHAQRIQQEGQYVRSRSVDHCLGDIRHVVSHYNVKALYFNDDCFTANRKWWPAFCEKYEQEFKIPFYINTRPETLNDEICARLKAAGCARVSVGIECGHEKFRSELLGRRQSNDRIINAFDACRRAGIKTKSFNIVGFPYETPEIFQETINLNARVNPDSLIIGVFEPYVGTELAKVCEKEGWIDMKRWLNDDFVGRTDTVLEMPQFTRAQILKAYRNFAFNVYKRISFKKALTLRVYYSQYGQFLLWLLTPFRSLLRKATMGV